MDAAGVDVQVLSPWTDLTAYALERDQAVAWARLYNETLAEEAASDPGRFRAVGTVPLASPEAAGEELRRAIGELGLVGAEIATRVEGAELDDPSLEPFWTAADETGALVLVHPLRPLDGRGISRYRLGNLVGNPAETTIAGAHLVFGGVLERHPALRVCLVHGGGFLPYQAGRLERGYAAQPERTAANLTRSPREWLRHLYYDTVLHDPRALAFLVDVVGESQVLLGSDYPFAMGEPRPVKAVREAGLSGGALAAVLGGNARRLLEDLGA
jgi:aminocarboxymuconate-semialdehyde decarboxylase